MAGWRLLVGDAADGAWNMALDEALLAWHAARPEAPPTVRVYGWAPGALSLGRFQDAGSSCDRHFLRSAGLDLVRRPTGGAAVLHEHERTYAVAGTLGRSAFPGGVIDTYRTIAHALVAAYRALGVEVGDAAPDARAPSAAAACFDAPSAHELVWRGRKLAGSAQARRGRAFLQHGSLPLVLDPDRLAAAVGRPVDTARFADLRTAAARVVSGAELDSALVAALARTLGEAEPAEPERATVELATRLRAEKYLDLGWTLRGEAIRPDR
jgi:lipoate-protein ligase A